MNPLNVLKRVEVIDIPFIGMSEEELQIPPSFDQEAEVRSVEEGEVTPTPILEVTEPILLDGFIDGVQRTVRWKICRTPEGARIPIHISAIGTGLLWRDNDGHPLIGHKRIWYILVGPFAEMEKDPEIADKLALELGALTQSEVYNDPFLLLSSQKQWIVADTSVKLGEMKSSIGKSELLNESVVRTKAMGRIAHLRTYLELSILIGIRSIQKDSPHWLREVGEKHFIPDLLKLTSVEHPFLLLDGPLLLTAKRRERIRSLLPRASGSEVERFLLRRAAGFIKTHRLRVREIEKVLNLHAGERSRAYDLTRETDLHGQNLKEEITDDGYPSRHLTFYLRMLERKESSLYGLIRIDLHRSAVNPEKAVLEHEKPLNPNEQKMLNQIAAGIFRERFPLLQGRFQPAPIALLEDALHSSIPPAIVLKNLIY